MTGNKPREFIRVSIYLTPSEYEDLDKKQPIRDVARGEGVWYWVRERLGLWAEPFGWHSKHRIISEREYVESKKDAG